MPRRTLWYGFAAGVPFLVIVWWTIRVPYSFWLDEMFSVGVSARDWAGLLDALLADVHPPLYQVLLKLWIMAFGTGEVAVRILSAVLASGAILILVGGLRREPPSLVLPAVLFVAATNLFLRFAQEARSYAMLLALSMLAVVLLYRRSQRSGAPPGEVTWYAALLALSLVHYFGLLLALLLLLVDRPRGGGLRDLAGRCAVGLALLVWPVYHLLQGRILEKTGGQFWIPTEGALYPTRTALEALFGGPTGAIGGFLPGGPVPGFPSACVVVAGFVVVVAWLGLRASSEDARWILGQLCAVVLAFLVIVTLIDLHTPVSTQRNFIVLLPVVAVALGISVSALWARSERRAVKLGLGLAILLHVGVSGSHGLERLEWKQGPYQNWKGLATKVDALGLCDPHCWFFGPEGGWRASHYAFYFAHWMPPPPNRATLTAADLREVQPDSGLPIVGAHVGADAFNALREMFPTMACWQPRQTWPNAVFVLIDDTVDAHPLVPCESR